MMRLSDMCVVCIAGLAGNPHNIAHPRKPLFADCLKTKDYTVLIIWLIMVTWFQRDFNAGKIEIYVTVPDVNSLSVSGSGDILAKELEARILNLAVSGSGNITIEDLDSKKVKGAISGSGNISLEDGGVADELSVSISGSGNFDAEGFDADAVSVATSGSGNCKVSSDGSIKARIAGSGSVYYKGNASIDSSVAGSGRVKKM